MIIALQTADATCRIWLLEPVTSQTLPEPRLVWESGRSLADELLPRLVGLLREHKLQLSRIKGFIVFSGPGSFTSLRIGHTVANALADSLTIPVVGARGEHWLEDGLRELVHTPAGQPALPYYGAEATITKPKA